MASRLFNYFLMCWVCKSVDEENLSNAVAKDYITEEEKQNIMATPR
ncbi:hypothetical protein POF51_13460 [Brevibacillus sp. AG]|nr:hypothetical protein [Brevibacillus sp. AG]MDC0761708.1 hypothetical protein [Brevibacillus sp. AG]